MNTTELVEWQKLAPNGLVYPWWTHPFLDVLETWDLKDKVWLEFGAGRSTAWLRSKCKYVVSIEANLEWAAQANSDCALNNLYNGRVLCEKDLPDGQQDRKQEYFDLIPLDILGHDLERLYPFDIISIDGIWRTECIQWAIDHFKGRGGIIVIDNLDQDFVWISPKAMELIEPYESEVFIQPNHINHEGKPWNTRWVKIPA